ncbi:trypsin-like peptidase domain-containing protein [candidate division KSB1 bacterium]|nr:trypsin-like peptidase domain-containing protein [candidate division KSB1 bacterium]
MKTGMKIIFAFCFGALLTIFLVLFCTNRSSEQTANLLQSTAAKAHPASANLDRILQQDAVANSRQNAITNAIARVSPAVVSINTRKIEEYYQQNPLAIDPFWQYFFPRYNRVMQEVHALGSGFLFSPNGHILTNQHVINAAREIIVTLPGGEEYKAELAGEDFKSDVAVLKIDGKNFPYIPMGNSDDIIIGEWAIAIGNPFGLFDVFAKPTVTVGVISATDQDFGRQSNQRVYEDMIQTDAAINSGNSGGPLVNSEGNVIGMNAFIFTGSQDIGTSIGLGFALPINRVKEVAQELLTHGSIPKDLWSGLQYQDITNSMALLLRLNSTQGVIVTDVERNSPWDDAGLQAEDVILEINGNRLRSSAEFDGLKESLKLKVGDELELTVYRNRRIYSARVKFKGQG